MFRNNYVMIYDEAQTYGLFRAITTIYNHEAEYEAEQWSSLNPRLSPAPPIFIFLEHLIAKTVWLRCITKQCQ